MTTPLRTVATLLALAAVGLAGCTTAGAAADTAAPAASSGAGYPVEVKNCDRTLHFDKAPTRIVTGWSTSAELLIELGVADRIVGKYNTSSGTPLPKYAAAYDRIPTIGDNAPTREQLIATKPDLIWADGDYLFDGKQLPTIQDLTAQGIQVMILSGFCTQDADGARVGDVYTDLAALGTILGITVEAGRVKADLDRRLADVAAQTEGKGTVPVAMLGMYETSLLTFEGVYTDIAARAGATNLYAGTLPAGKYYGEVSVEDVTRKNPATIVYLLGGGEDEAKARARLASTLPTVDAVKNNRIIFLPQAYSTNLAGIEGVERLAAALHP
jgi:iron complex transport system substrate-binding protein